MLEGFNRYMVECESVMYYIGGYRRLLVLIDTWWNVNLTLDDISFHRLASFNRYMVECELREDWKPEKEPNSFNRYMVECESWSKYSMFPINLVLIDTWWNVNF